LWREYARLIGELRPRYVIVENVAALLGRGLGDVLGDLAALGYDSEWHCIPASAVGAPHRRDRIWIVAYPNDAERRQVGGARHGLAERADGIFSDREEGSSGLSASREAMADAAGYGRREDDRHEQVSALGREDRGEVDSARALLTAAFTRYGELLVQER
jgi:site-specific DNA-cytosine methylase